MSKIQEEIRQLSAEIKQTAQRLELWGTDLLDRLIIDWKSRKDMELVKVDFSKTLGFGAWCQHEGKQTVKMYPNSVRYEGDNQAYSWIWELLGMRKRTEEQGGKIIMWLNGPRNKFLLYWFRLMGYNRDCGKGVEYWRLAKGLMKTDVFILASLNHVVPGWEKIMPINDVKKILSEVRELILKRPIRMDYLRVYIDKDMTGSGVKRPLGVPTVPWRIYLHMWNAILVWWTMKDLPLEQHAYQPKKGTFTAWQSLVLRLSWDNIYEFDLSNFFGKVNLKFNREVLISSGVPIEESEYLYRLNQSIVGLRGCGWGGEDKVDESAHRRLIWNTDGSPNPNLERESYRKLCACKDCGSDVGARVMEEKRLLDEGFGFKQEAGIPQGASTSCGLSILNLKRLFEWNPGIIMYADDGIIFPESSADELKLTDKEAGIEQALHKSSWLKREGVWEKSIKFLGLEWIPSGVSDKEGGEPKDYPRLRGFTRGLKDPSGRGSRLELGVRQQMLAWVDKSYEDLRKKVFIKEDGQERSIYEVVEEWENPGKKVSDWLEEKLKEFEKMEVSERIKGVFTEPAGPTLISRMYNYKDTWEIEREKAVKLEAHKDSWCAKFWARYVYNLAFSGRVFEIMKNLVKYEGLVGEELKRVEESLEILGEFSVEDQREALWNLHIVNEDILRSEGVSEESIQLLKNHREELEIARESWRCLLELLELNISNSSSMAMDDLTTSYATAKEWTDAWSEDEMEDPIIQGYVHYNVRNLMPPRKKKSEEEIREEKKKFNRKAKKRSNREVRDWVRRDKGECQYLAAYRGLISTLEEKNLSDIFDYTVTLFRYTEALREADRLGIIDEVFGDEDESSIISTVEPNNPSSSDDPDDAVLSELLTAQKNPDYDIVDVEWDHLEELVEIPTDDAGSELHYDNVGPEFQQEKEISQG